MGSGCCLAMGLVIAMLGVGTQDSGPSHESRDVAGWTVRVDPRLLNAEAELGRLALAMLRNDLDEITWVLPADKVSRLQKVVIWLDLDSNGLSGMQYHPSKKWLVDHGHAPELARAVHIPTARSYVNLVRKNHQPWVVLHELAHAYHDQVLGFDHAAIRESYEAAVASGRYDSVLHVRGKRTRHYALTDHKEYFAELTEAYFGTNDFYPFVRAELKEHDPDALALIGKIWKES